MTIFKGDFYNPKHFFNKVGTLAALPNFVNTKSKIVCMPRFVGAYALTVLLFQAYVGCFILNLKYESRQHG